MRMSEDEFLGSGLVDEHPSWEFVNGDVFRKRTMTKRDHVDLVKRLVKLLMRYEDEAGGYYGSETTVNMSRGSDRRYRVPDLAFWAAGRTVGHPTFEPPTLAIEVRSPEQSMRQLREKCAEYRERGVEVCWLIDPDSQTVEVWSHADAGAVQRRGALLETPILPGFALDTAYLFRAIERD